MYYKYIKQINNLLHTWNFCSIYYFISRMFKLHISEMYTIYVWLCFYSLLLFYYDTNSKFFNFNLPTLKISWIKTPCFCFQIWKFVFQIFVLTTIVFLNNFHKVDCNNMDHLNIFRLNIYTIITFRQIRRCIGIYWYQ